MHEYTASCAVMPTETPYYFAAFMNVLWHAISMQEEMSSGYKPEIKDNVSVVPAVMVKLATAAASFVCFSVLHFF